MTAILRTPAQCPICLAADQHMPGCILEGRPHARIDPTRIDWHATLALLWQDNDAELWEPRVAAVTTPEPEPEPDSILRHLALGRDGRLLVRMPEPDAGERPPFGITPGWHDVVTLLRAHKYNFNAVQYIADMIEI